MIRISNDEYTALFVGPSGECFAWFPQRAYNENTKLWQTVWLDYVRYTSRWEGIADLNYSYRVRT